ncbi:acyl-CoA carboxylase subunit epsilon [Nocardia altamirensis]|uniref:acyl-CoA carboxylase subunit epsilon n=1 Tax=Nocardia altamirensis TaxID=472158 RepID=UPI0008407B5C|nr:acyl-CoA carboxylase subunit epsilon [Nocardia altamirensis]
MTTVAEEEVLTAAELDLTVEELADVVETEGEAPALVADLTATTGEPLFRVVKGNPSDEELAALVCVLTAAVESAAASQSGPADMWGRPTMMHRGTSPFSPYAFPQLSHLRG